MPIASSPWFLALLILALLGLLGERLWWNRRKSGSTPSLPVDPDDSRRFTDMARDIAAGNLDQAAAMLRQYLDRHPEDWRRRLQLLDLYTELRQESGIATLFAIGLHLHPHPALLERLPAAHRDYPNNPVLLALMREHLPADGQLPADALTTPSSPTISPPSTTQSPSATTASPTSTPETVHDVAPLLMTDDPQPVPVDPHLIPLLSALGNPYRIFQLLWVAGQIHEAETLLHRALVFQPQSMRLHVALLQLLYQQERRDDYARALMRLWLVLAGLGADLRHRLLNLGEQLGPHAYWPILHDTDTKPLALVRILQHQGIGLPSSVWLRHDAPLLEEYSPAYIAPPAPETGTGDIILDAFQLFLEYGQVDEARNVLEEALLRTPQHGAFYPPLADLHERLRDPQHLGDFLQNLEGRSADPDGLGLLTQVHQRLLREARIAAQGGRS